VENSVNSIGYVVKTLRYPLSLHLDVKISVEPSLRVDSPSYEEEAYEVPSGKNS
jgi:hypothetical protein